MIENIINTLVIGGAGYIGAHLVPQLISIGRKVTVLGRNPYPRHPLPQNVSYVSGDFSNDELISDLLLKHTEVIHLAYATVPNTSFENPLQDLQQNLSPAVTLFSKAAVLGVKLMLVSSGGTVYGEAIDLPISEAHTTRPISPYGVTKVTLENYAHLYAETHGLKFVCVRPANAYGVGQQPFVGQGFIATAMASAMKKLPVRIFGNRGTVRDYLYVSDLASGIVSALLHGRLSQTYNIGSGAGVSNLQIVELFRPLLQELGHQVQVENLPERAFDVKANVLSAAKLRMDTGWQPKITLNEGLVLTRDWLAALGS